MISMYTKQEIILRSYREGKSQRCISVELSIHRKTVSKFITDYEDWKTSNKDAPLSCYLSQPARYDSSNRGRVVLTTEVESIIDNLLSLNEKSVFAGKTGIFEITNPLSKMLIKSKEELEIASMIDKNREV